MTYEFISFVYEYPWDLCSIYFSFEDSINIIIINHKQPALSAFYSIIMDLPRYQWISISGSVIDVNLIL